MTFLILAALAGAVANRIRGGLFPLPGDAPGRIIWGIVCGIIAWQPGVPWWVPCGVAVGAFLGTLAGEFNAQSLGHRGGVGGARASLDMGFWGFLRVALPAAVIWWAGGAWWWVLASGIACPALYQIAWGAPKWAYSIPRFGYGNGPAEGFDPDQTAQAIHGVALGAVLYLVIHNIGVSP